MNLKDHTRQVADKLIEQLKTGTAPWQKPWEDSLDNTVQRNGSTSRAYHGINQLYLDCQGKDDPRWFTFNQIRQQRKKDQSLFLKKGSKGVGIEFWQFTKEEEDQFGKQQTVKLDRPRCYHFAVFNGADIQGLAPLPREPTRKPQWADLGKAEALLQDCVDDYQKGNPDFAIKQGGNRAFYSVARDYIQVPKKEQFQEASRYYATVFHELSHSTGHPSRLDRDLMGGFGSESYAKEELRAEIGSMLLGQELGIGHDGENHASYVESWIKVLQNDPREIFRACADAEKIQKFVLDKGIHLDQEMKPDIKPSPVIIPETTPKPEQHREQKRVAGMHL